MKINSPRIVRDILKSVYLLALIIIVMFISSLVYVYLSVPQQLFERQKVKLVERVVQSKKDYIKSMVLSAIRDIELEEQVLKTEFKMHQGMDAFNDTLFHHILKERCLNRIRNTILEDNGYIWVNEILDYNGGDGYAIRLVHGNLPETEGMLLSTSMVDKKGGKPYQVELDGVLKDGELYQKYWFKKKDSDSIAEKLSYAKLYKNLNWVIASGVYLDDVELIVQADLRESEHLYLRQIKVTLTIIGSLLVLVVFTISFFRIKFQNIVNYYVSQVGMREKSLKEFNDNLEEIIEERTQQLQESEEIYSSIFKSNQTVMLLINPRKMTIVEANQAAVDFYGYSFEDLVGMRIDTINISGEESIKEAIDSVRNEKLKYFIFKHRLANAEVKDVEVYSERIFVNGDDLLFSIIHDITELKKTQSELVIAKDLAEESDRLKSSFLANMSHEIRTPMNGILGFTSLLKEEDLSEMERLRFIGIIDKSGKHLLSIINDVIDISKIESNQITANISSFNINENIEYIYNFFLPEAYQLGLELEYHKSLPNSKAIISSDQDKVNAILTNLVKNAIKFTPQGRIDFGYRDLGSKLEFFVKDTGLGINETDQTNIFMRFRQVENRENKSIEGSGLGLAICKAYVSLLGGKIWVKSEISKGSVFYFTIPLHGN